MVVVNLKGGLGNQLFQIAAGYAHSLRMGCEFAINYELFSGCLQGYGPVKYKNTLFKNIPTTSFIPKAKYSESSFCYKEIPKVKDILLDGYFQSEKYFTDYADKIKQLFVFCEGTKNKVGNKLDGKIVAHVRRGDYLNLSHIHKIIDIEYYKQSLKLLGTDDKTVYITTDSPEIVTREFNNIDFIIINGKTELEDLYCLTRGNFIIGSNSSFAWWGAWLGNHTKKIFPKTWFGLSGPADFHDIYCKDFITL